MRKAFVSGVINAPRRLGNKITCTTSGTSLSATAASTTTVRTSSMAVNVRTMASLGRPSLPMLEKVVVKVPTMGDSITEGTIVEWQAQIGQAVKEDDVIALIETDKVTIDIKAEINGVITQHYGNIDDNIEVGSDLYEIDTEAAPTTTQSTEATTSTTTETSNETSIADTTTSSSSSSVTDETPSVRVPSIKFLGKEGWTKRKTAVGTSTTIQPSSTSSTTNVITDATIGPMYGRLPFSEREMEALIMGGASETPAFNTN